MSEPMPPLGTPEREWFRKGAAAEAHLREKPYKALPKATRDFTDYIDALVRHNPEEWTPGSLLRNVTYVFQSTFTKAEKRAIRRALRGRR